MSHSSTAGLSASSGAPLYRKLRPRPNGPARAEVVANQRARLHGAMVEASATHGYAATSVAELCRLAGVSKRTFYEQFQNKQECFLASYERVVASAVSRVRAARPPESDCETRLTSAIEVLLLEIAERPKESRLVLLEAKAAGPAVLARRERRRIELARIIAAVITEEAPGVRSPPIVASGIAFGVERVLCMTLTAQDLDHPADMAQRLARWILAYRSPAIAGLARAGLPAMEEGTGHRSAPERTGGVGRRARVLHAAAEIVSTEGHARLTAAKIAARAGVSEQQLADCYSSPAECFLDAVDLLGLKALMSAVRAARSTADGVAGVCLGIAALLDDIATDGVLRGALFSEGPDPSSAAAGRGERLTYRVVDALSARLPDTPRDQTWVEAEAAIGALWGVVNYHVTRDASQILPALSAQVSYLALAPLVGADAVSDVFGRSELQRRPRS